jgi:hypothetical protein
LKRKKETRKENRKEPEENGENNQESRNREETQKITRNLLEYFQNREKTKLGAAATGMGRRGPIATRRGRAPNRARIGFPDRGKQGKSPEINEYFLWRLVARIVMVK